MIISKHHVSQTLSIEEYGRLLAEWRNSARSKKPRYFARLRVVILERNKLDIRNRDVELWPELIARVLPEEADRLKTANRGGGEIGAALRLLSEDLLPITSPCPHCKKYFFKRTKKQTFCSQRCQIAHYKSSDEWRAHRREYMRGHRRGEVERDAKAKKLARELPSK